ncbi:hypothetical protein A8A01_03655 [Ewingella americana]|nr:hypothetical protein A8A01_03655 [Ewingella americana]
MPLGQTVHAAVDALGHRAVIASAGWLKVIEAREKTEAELAALRGEQEPVGNGFLPNNLDRALMVVGMVLPESKEEFNFQAQRWMQRLIDRVKRA